MYLYVIVFIIFLYILFDVNYFLRTYFTVLWGHLFERNYLLGEVTTIYGICMFQDCDIWFRNSRVARLIREIDFARYHYYHRTGIYQRSRKLKIRSLQGCTFTICKESVPLFTIYKIITKLVYWDDQSLFFEHKIVRLQDGNMMYLIISRQHAIGANGESTEALLKGIPGSEEKPSCPKDIEDWLKSMQITSNKIRNA